MRGWIKVIAWTFAILLTLLVIGVFFANLPKAETIQPHQNNVTDCYKACENAYHIEGQIIVCEGTCDYYGMPSKQLDNYIAKLNKIGGK